MGGSVFACVFLVVSSPLHTLFYCNMPCYSRSSSFGVFLFTRSLRFLACPVGRLACCPLSVFDQSHYKDTILSPGMSRDKGVLAEI